MSAIAYREATRRYYAPSLPELRDRELDPPDPGNLTVDEERAASADLEAKRAELVAEALTGRGDFFVHERYDVEQEFTTFEAVRDAMQLDASPAAKWAALEKALTKPLADYAAFMTRDDE